jgi:hypothetical protein
MNLFSVFSSPAARRQRGASMVESLTATFVMSLVVVSTLGLVSIGNKTVDRRTRENGFTGVGRATLDELLREVRAGNQIMKSFTINGTTVTTNATTLLVEGPGIDPSSQQGIIPGTYDVCAFIYDPQAKTIRESTVIGTGSVRARRRDLILARNVSRVEIIYRVREAIITSTGQKTFTLSARPTQTPRVYVNGALRTSGWWYFGGSTPAVVFNDSPGANADVQIQYPIDPTRNGGSDLAYVTTIIYTATMSEGAAKGTVTLSGTARLRNSRI